MTPRGYLLPIPESDHAAFTAIETPPWPLSLRLLVAAQRARDDGFPHLAAALLKLHAQIKSLTR